MKTSIITKKRLFIGGLLAILVFSSFLYTPVTADGDEDEDGIDDDIEDENRRDVEVEDAPYEVQISSSIYNNGIENEFQIKVSVGSDGLSLELEFEEGNETIETEIEFDVEITEILEFRDISGEGIYNLTDDIAQVVELEDFKPIVYSTQSIENTTVHILEIETIYEIFSATVYVSDEFTNISGIIVAPTEIKIDIGIHNFNYTEPDSQLALKVELDSESEVEYEEDEETEDEENGYADDEHEIEISLNDYSGFFSWSEKVFVDGFEQEVKVTPFEEISEESIMYLNYPRGTEIIHDPKIGVQGILSGIDLPDPTETPFNWVQLINPSQVELLIVTGVSLMIVTSLVLIFRKRKVN